MKLPSKNQTFIIGGATVAGVILAWILIRRSTPEKTQLVDRTIRAAENTPDKKLSIRMTKAANRISSINWKDGALMTGGGVAAGMLLLVTLQSVGVPAPMAVAIGGVAAVLAVIGIGYALEREDERKTRGMISETSIGSQETSMYSSAETAYMGNAMKGGLHPSAMQAMAASTIRVPLAEQAKLAQGKSLRKSDLPQTGANPNKPSTAKVKKGLFTLMS